MVVRKILKREELCEVMNEVLETLGFKSVPIQAIPSLKPIFDVICKLSEDTDGAEDPFLVGIPHLRLRDGVLYRDVSVVNALDVLLKQRQIDDWEGMILTPSPGLEDEAEGIRLLWDLSKEEVAALLAAGKEFVKPPANLTIPQLRSVNLVGENQLNAAAILIARYLVEHRLFPECQLEFEATRHLALAQYKEQGYEILPAEHHVLFNAWSRFVTIGEWKKQTLNTILRIYPKE